MAITPSKMKEKNMNGKTYRVYEKNGITISLYETKSGRYYLRWSDSAMETDEASMDIVVRLNKRHGIDYAKKLFKCLEYDLDKTGDGFLGIIAAGHAGIGGSYLKTRIGGSDVWTCRKACEKGFIGLEPWNE